jgi:hypothetical protein
MPIPFLRGKAVASARQSTDCRTHPKTPNSEVFGVGKQTDTVLVVMRTARCTQPSFIPTVRSAPEFHRIVRGVGYDHSLVGYTTDRELPRLELNLNSRLTLPRRFGRLYFLLYTRTVVSGQSFAYHRPYAYSATLQRLSTGERRDRRTRATA